MDRPTILHVFTPRPHASPFDVNMAADAGWQLVVPYAHVTLDDVTGLTQDAIFSRGPKGVARTGIFIGGRDPVLAADMLERARQAMVPPFVVSTFADPSGAYTTAAALVARAEAALRAQDGRGLEGRNVLLLGGTGPVGRIAAVLCAREGALTRLASRHGMAAAQAVADETAERFGVSLRAASSREPADLQAALGDAEVVLAVAAAGVQVMSAADRARAPSLRVAADVNAVPPAGIEGVGVMDDAKPIPGSRAVGIGALAVGNLKYQVQNRLLARMREAEKPVALGWAEAFAVAREVVAAPKG